MSITGTNGIVMLRDGLEGRNIQVRPFGVSDITPEYLEWLCDPEVIKFSNQRFHTHTIDTCRDYLASFDGTANHFLAICDQKTGDMLGTMTVYCNPHHGTADLGIMVGRRSVWGLGIGEDAFCTVMSAVLDSGIIRKVTAGTLAVNIGMVRVMEKAGMHHEATRRAQELLNGDPVDVVYYARFCDV